MYELRSHLNMMQDPLRAPAYTSAIRAVVRPGDVVLDLGAGAGFMSFVALEAGAAHVYAIEDSPIVAVARDVARTNGCLERLTCIQRDSMRVELPQRVDVIVADLRGALPILKNNLQVFADARRRHLKPGGRLIPQEDLIFLAPVDCPQGYAAVEGWRARWGGADYSEVARLAANQWNRCSLLPENLLATPQAMGCIDYACDPPPEVAFAGRFPVIRPGFCDGIGAWFEAHLAPGVTYSCAPGQPETAHGRAFFPLITRHPVEIGDTIGVQFRVRFPGGRPFWTWSLSIEARGKPQAAERHSTFEGTLINLERLAMHSAEFVPELDEDGQIDRFILERMNGEIPLGEIARELWARFPQTFASREQALGRAGKLSERYARPKDFRRPSPGDAAALAREVPR